MYDAKDEITVRAQTKLMIDRKKVNSLSIWKRELSIDWIYRL